MNGYQPFESEEPIVGASGPSQHDRDEERARRHLRAQSAEWSDRHRVRVDQIVAELLADAPDSDANRALLLRLVATEVALFERLTELEQGLVERALVLVDQPSLLLKVTRALKDATAVSGAIGRRVESLLRTSALLGARRELTVKRNPADGPSHLRVA